MIVYRIEHIESGVGPIHSGSIDYKLHMAPCDSRNFIKWVSKKDSWIGLTGEAFIFGHTKFAELLKIFSPKCRERLNTKGFKFFKIEIDASDEDNYFIMEDGQIGFRKTIIKKKEPITRKKQSFVNKNLI